MEFDHFSSSVKYPDMNAVEDHANWTISREVGLNYTLSGQVVAIHVIYVFYPLWLAKVTYLDRL